VKKYLTLLAIILLSIGIAWAGPVITSQPPPDPHTATTTLTGKFLAFDAAESHTTNITSVPNNNPVVRQIRLYIEDDPGADANVNCRLSFYNSDSMTEDELITDFYFNLTYSEWATAITSSSSLGSIDSVAGLVLYDLVRFMGGTAENVRLYTTAPSVATNQLTFTITTNAHTGDTGVVRIHEITDVFQLYDSDSTGEIHAKLEMYSDPGNSVDVVIQIDVQ